MEFPKSWPKAAILSAANDATTVRPYGEGYLVGIPLAYSDGDTVTLLVAPWGADRLRVTDRADAFDRLSEAGVNPSTGRAYQAFTQVFRDLRLDPVGSQPSEIATTCTPDEIGTVLWAVATAAIRVEQLRWLAQDQPVGRFANRVTARLQAVAGSRWNVDTHRLLQLRSGRERRITAVVEGTRGVAYVQAVSLARDYSSSVAQTYLTFDRSVVERERRVSALSGHVGDWDTSFVDDLKSVSEVAFFDDGDLLESAIAGIVGSAQATAIGS